MAALSATASLSLFSHISVMFLQVFDSMASKVPQAESLSSRTQFKWFGLEALNPPQVNPTEVAHLTILNLMKGREVDDRELMVQCFDLAFLRSSLIVPLKDQAAGSIEGHVRRTPPSLTAELPNTVEKLNPLQTPPDVGKVFDDLLSAKNEGFNPHPNKISGMAFAFATVISLTLSRTCPSKWEYNDTAHCFDLSPLYGLNEKEEELVRDKNGQGMLSPDCFCEDRRIFLMPAVSVLLVLWNRNHNFIARRLLIDKDSKWIDPSTVNPSADRKLHPDLADQDDKIFKTAHMINCGIFRNVVLEDFLKGLLGLPNDVLSSDGQKAKSMQQYRSRTEFSLLYNWSALASEEDMKWTEKTIQEIFNGKSPDTPTLADFQHVSGCCGHETNLANKYTPNLQDHHLRRFDCGGDDYIARLNTLNCWYTWVLKNGPLCVNNGDNGHEAGKGMESFTSFKEWNLSPDIITAATSLYGDIENLELYPGLQAEDPVCGSGFNFGHTMIYGILVEIITLVWDDPNLPKFTAKEMTDWGYNECLAQLDNGASGAVLPKVLLANLPQNYPYNNIYTLFPFTLPSATKDVLGPDLADYNTKRPEKTVVLKSEKDISAVFNDPESFPTMYGPKLRELTNRYGFLLGFDNTRLHDAEQVTISYALIPDRREMQRHAVYFAETVEGFIKETERSWISGSAINIVKDVINPTCSCWVCEAMYGLPQHSRDRKNHEAEVFKKFGDLYTNSQSHYLTFSFLFHIHESDEGWAVRKKALDAVKELATHIRDQVDVIKDDAEEGIIGRLNYAYNMLQSGECEVKPLSSTKFLKRLSLASGSLQRALGGFEKFQKFDDFKDFWGTKLQGAEQREPQDKRLSVQLDKNAEEEFKKLRLVSNVLILCIISSVGFARAWAHAVEFYLHKDCSKERNRIAELSQLDTAKGTDKGTDKSSDSEIMGYIREAQRLGQSPGLFRVVKKKPTTQQLEGLQVKEGDLIYADFRKAHIQKTCSEDRAVPPEDFPTQMDHPARVTENYTVPDEDAPTQTDRPVKVTEDYAVPGEDFPTQTDHPSKVVKDHAVPCEDVPTQMGDPTKVVEDPTNVFKAIFRLNITLADEHESSASHNPILSPYSNMFVDSNGKFTSIPQTLLIREKYTTRQVDSPRQSFGKVTTVESDYVLTIWGRLSALLALPSVPKLTLPSIPRPWVPLALHAQELRPSTPIEENPANITVATLEVFDPYHVEEIRLGLDNKPIPVKRTYERGRPYQLTIIDVDKRDMRVSIFVDGILRGVTTDFDLDKLIDCELDSRACVALNFSTGVIVILLGNHTVEVRWAGKEYANGTDDADWGGEDIRRFQMQVEDYAGS
ncbi:hypothetical protein JAAARDRAFT_50265 [Jaapia argillacea MUCL 33604]|uniref:Heme peroxidase n=1 Tax=Jaapia argillacea MUCL 33604 TaxID=933084 RepID=A0A067PQN1_9AGAM|nr:hypothetical protein JAAARDRAFT_50265 [Jaapia argillacea MUCL 33604]